jgi:cardiolipin synthase
MNFTIPNLLSLLRMGLVPLFIIALTEREAGRALLIFAVAGITDALDGLIARFFHQQTLLGTYLDPAADKLLLTSAYVVLAIPGLNPALPIPLWVTVLVIARDVVIVVVALALHVATGHRKFPPTLLGKLTTASQVTAIALVLAAGTGPGAGLQTAASAVVYLTAVLTVASGLHYLLLANRIARTAEEPPPGS